MPYIKHDARNRIGAENILYPHAIDNAGELNYAFTIIIDDYFYRKHNYQGINDIIGALEGAKLEFERRKVFQYEDTKIKENGDVYTV